MSNLDFKKYLERGYKMQLVSDEAKSLLNEYKDILEFSKNEVISNLKEFALEEAKIRLENVIVWDQGTIDIVFGPETVDNY